VVVGTRRLVDLVEKRENELHIGNFCFAAEDMDTLSSKRTKSAEAASDADPRALYANDDDSDEKNAEDEASLPKILDDEKPDARM
jgi:hypothetical protein